MKKILFLVLGFIFIINTNIFAYEDDNFKVNDKDWKVVKQGKSVIFYLNSSIPVFAEDTGKEILEEDYRPYMVVRVKDYSELKVADFSQKGLEDFKNDFEKNDFSRFVKNYKKTIRNNILKKQPGLLKDQVEGLVDLALGETKINSASLSKIGNFDAYKMEYKMGVIESKHYIVPTLNKEYYVILEYMDLIDVNKVKQCDEFFKSLELKDKAPTKMNEFLYGNGLKILLGIILISTLVLYKLVKR